MKREETIKNRITMGDILAAVVKADYTILGDTTTTICQLTLTNGYTVIGKSACIDKALFDKTIGEKVAWNDALERVWELEGYLLQQKRFEAGLT